MSEKTYKYMGERYTRGQLLAVCHEDLQRQIKRYESLSVSYKRFLKASRKQLEESGINKDNIPYPTLLHVRYMDKLNEKVKSAYSVKESKLKKAIESDDFNLVVKYIQTATKKGLKLYNSISETLLLGIRKKDDVETFKTFVFEEDMLSHTIKSLKSLDNYICQKIEKEMPQEESEEEPELSE